MIMPSVAYSTLMNSLLTDVDRLIDTHVVMNQQIYKGAQGRRHLGHLTRSAVLMLCAAWERYMELLSMETVEQLLSRADHPDKLPKQVRKELAKIAIDSKNELHVLKMANSGWKDLLRGQATNLAGSLNTPKHGPLDMMFERLTGLSPLSGHWTVGAQVIDDFVSARGDIAHTGSKAGYIAIGTLQTYRTMVPETARETDNAIADHIANIFPDDGRPWRRKWTV
jgi:HEPN superfamily RiboL-PSP-like protein